MCDRGCAHGAAPSRCFGPRFLFRCAAGCAGQNIADPNIQTSINFIQPPAPPGGGSAESTRVCMAIPLPSPSPTAHAHAHVVQQVLVHARVNQGASPVVVIDAGVPGARKLVPGARELVPRARELGCLVSFLYRAFRASPLPTPPLRPATSGGNFRVAMCHPPPPLLLPPLLPSPGNKKPQIDQGTPNARGRSIRRGSLGTETERQLGQRAACNGIEAGKCHC